MKTRVLITVSVFLGLSGGIILGARPFCYGHGQEKEERPKFYAIRVVSEKNVLNAKDSLGVPDGRYAEILQGGQLVLLMEKKLYVFPVGSLDEGGGLAYSGVIVAKGETTSVFEGWLPINEAQGVGHAWIPIGQSSTFYYILPEGIVRTDKIRIKNTGTESVFVDAVIGYGLETERKWEAVAFRGVKLTGGRPPVWENNNLLNIPGEMGPMKAIRRWIYATEKRPF